MEAAPSRTAMLAAVARGLHRLEAAPPWVLDDAFALVLVGPAWQELRKGPVSLFPAEVVREVFAGVCTRSRYAEDRLAAGAFAQYVILGAGLDSYPARADLQERYFADRTDGLRPFTAESLVTARVTGT